ncbi:molybdopterin molybdotransferase MoeA [Pilimelia terevasa]|uniref:molybdopterin molybdotransferase MoeA n=1 Tax=Pilimelia terevasa TaxID=53372 RepID=UPI001E28FB74|nr:molybdopterin-binding protein [Pilimelia terevasa]
MSVDWHRARELAHAAGAAAARPARRLPLAGCDGATLAEALCAGTDLPAFRTCAVDGWAVRGAGPWRVVGRAAAGSAPPPLEADGTAVAVATGAPVPRGAAAVLRAEDTGRAGDGRITGRPPVRAQWRERAEEASAGDVLVPGGVDVTPAVLGLAAAGGHDTLPVRVAPAARGLVFGDELVGRGPAGGHLLRDALGPALPGWLARLGARHAAPPPQPLPDTPGAHRAALRAALAEADVVCTTGGTADGPADHVRAALATLGAAPVVDRVAVRPGHPMLLAAVPGVAAGGPRFVVALPGNPLAAVAGLLTLAGPLVSGLRGRPPAPCGNLAVDSAVAGAAGRTRLVPATVDPATGAARPAAHTGPAMLRGLAAATGLLVVPPGGVAAGGRADFLPLPLWPGAGA